VADKVVDASAVVALLFNERKRDEVVARLRSASLHAPSLIAFEVANACLKKMRASPAERPALLEAFALFDHLAIAPHQVDFGATLALADRLGLSFYDAAYLWLAATLGAELVTLDDKLARADRNLRGS
jgi:predicted nucleic acid-binding protein